jgi:hypothetical protein
MRVLPCLALVAVAVAAKSASAANAAKKRTPVIWASAPCMTIVDRSIDPVVELSYTIALEDPPAGEPIPLGEVADSRTHQFFAFSREHADYFYLPNWITAADVDAAAMLFIVDAAEVDADEVLETNAAWDGAWWRITSDAERRPITFAAAAEPVAWDTSTLDVGNYTVQGYTYEPAFNLYERRPGVIKVTDGGAPADYAPAIAFEPGELLLYRDSAAAMRVCVDAMEGSRVTAEWALLAAELKWMPFAEDVAVEGTGLDLDFPSPPALIGALGVVRAIVTDPLGREYTTHRSAAVTVLDEDDPCPAPCGGGSTGSADESGPSTGVAESVTSTDDAAATDGTDATVSASTQANGESAGENTDTRTGCGCAHGPSRWWTLLCVLAVVLARRREPLGLADRSTRA